MLINGIISRIPCLIIKKNVWDKQLTKSNLAVNFRPSSPLLFTAHSALKKNVVYQKVLRNFCLRCIFYGRYLLGGKKFLCWLCIQARDSQFSCSITPTSNQLETIWGRSSSKNLVSQFRSGSDSLNLNHPLLSLALNQTRGCCLVKRYCMELVRFST